MNDFFAAPVPPIPALAHNVDRPLWSVMIPTYNCADYLRLTLESVLRQDPGPHLMQIEVVDDVSTEDDPEAVVNEIGQGRVVFYRQPENVGAIANFNTCIQRVRGQLVHILHGDDLVKDGFYHRLGPPFLENEEIGAAFCRQIYIDNQSQRLLTTRAEKAHSGILNNALDILAVSNRIPPPAIVIKRKVYEYLGGFDPRLFHAADWEMWVRIAAHYPIWYEPEPLAFYRVHPGSDTSRLFKTGANMQNRRLAIDIFKQYLPSQRAGRLVRKAFGYAAIYGLRQSTESFLRTKDIRLLAVQLREAGICAWRALRV